MSAMVALRMDDVREEALRAALAQRGHAWGDVAHLTATNSLANAIADSGGRSLHIATLLDLIVLPGWPGPWRLPIEDFPDRGPELDWPGRTAAVRQWQRRASGLRVRMGVELDDRVRQYARSDGVDPRIGRVLIAGRRELSRTLHSLIAAGATPTGEPPADPVARAALEAWRQAEEHIEPLTVVRRDLWGDPARVRTAEGAELRHRVLTALDRAFGEVPKAPRILVHHGFHFFTPPQWALFRLLAAIPDLEQIFVVHDDGSSAPFEAWRRFFDPALGMPLPRETPAGDAPSITEPARRLRDALTGVEAQHGDPRTALRVVACRSPAELVREVRQAKLERHQAGEPTPRVYAPAADAVDRFVRRLSGGGGEGELVDLAQLPVGAFLLALHRSIGVRDGVLQVRFTADDLMDMASSALLGVRSLTEAGAPGLAKLRRALPFFRGCRDADEWTVRAAALRDVVANGVAPTRPGEPAGDDLERLSRAAGDHLGRVPWTDLDGDDVAMLQEVISAAATTARAVAARERVRLSDHVSFITDRLRAGMQDLPKDLQDEVLAQLEGFSTNLDVEVDADGLVDVVALLLGHEVQMDLTGEAGGSERSVLGLQGLDALGFERSQADIHIANLSDRSFPGSVQPVGWPFHLHDLAARGALPGESVDMLKVRRDTAAMSDLYLLWLALNGVEPGRTITLSYIEQLEGEPRNPSSVLALLTAVPGTSDALGVRIGGVKESRVASPADRPAATTLEAPGPVQDRDAALAGAAMLDHRVQAITHACPRRFAIQWAMGPTAAFLAEHHQSMLYGNTYAALRRGGMDQGAALRLCDAIWQHLSAGERASSRAKRVVWPRATTGAGARPEWNLTLFGSQGGGGPLDLAYQAAIGSEPTPPELVAAGDGSPLPPGVKDYDVCVHCPVKDRCTDAALRRD